MAEDLRPGLDSTDISRAGGFTLYPHLNRHGSTWRVFTQVKHSYYYAYFSFFGLWLDSELLL